MACQLADLGATRPGGDPWGPYEPAIAWWEAVTGRPAPAPTIEGPGGRVRANPVFVEWAMGYPQGAATGHGWSHAGVMRALGNAVVPQQAAAALAALKRFAETTG
jgi:DNA (cytosine-5)-methyltransferase 1